MFIIFGVSVEVISKIQRRFLVYILILFFCFTCAIRSFSVPDTSAYAAVFYALGSFDSIINTTYFEPMFNAVGFAIKRLFSEDVRVYFALIAFINVFLIFAAARMIELRLIFLSLSIYISFFGVYFNYCTLRSGLSFSFVLASYLTARKSIVLTFIFFAVSVALHVSSLIALFPLLLILARLRLTFQSYLIWLTLLILIYVSKPDRFYLPLLLDFLQGTAIGPFERFEYYLQNIEITEGYSFKIFFSLIIAGFIILSHRKLKPKYDSGLLLVYFLGLTIYTLFSGFVWIERVTDFYLPVNFLLLARVIEQSQNWYRRIFFSNLVFIIYAALSIRIVYPNFLGF